MTASPSEKNYTLGKGALFFDLRDPATGLLTGSRDLGNAPKVALSVSLSTLAHFSSRGGLKAKDKNLIDGVTPKISFTLEEITPDNWALMLLSNVEDVVQAAVDSNTKSLALVSAARYYDLGLRNVGITVLNYTTGTVAFTVGATLTDTVTSATATIVQIIGTVTAGVLYVSNVTGSFADTDALADDGTTPGAAVAAGTASVLTTAVSVEDTDNPGTFFVAGTDFTVDTVYGRLFIIDGGAIDGVAVKNLTVVFACADTNYKKIVGLKTTTLEGELRFISDNPVGDQYDMRAWRVSLAPTGDTPLIDDAWSSFSFEAEILKDATNHPLSPYIDVDILV